MRAIKPDSPMKSNKENGIGCRVIIPITGDKEIITAMKRGAKAVITGRSSRGTKTEDTFSLKGFTAAVEDASKRCK